MINVEYPDLSGFNDQLTIVRRDDPQVVKTRRRSAILALRNLAFGGAELWRDE